MSKLFLSYPVYGQCEYRSISSIHTALQRIDMPTRIYATCGESLIQRARASHLRVFLESDCDYFCSIDSDIQVALDTFQHLMEDMSYCDFAGGLYPLKNGTGKCSSVVKDERHSVVPFLYKAQWLSSGCWMVKREVFERMIEAYPNQWYHSDEPDAGHKTYDLYALMVIEHQETGKRKLLSEDWSFIHRAQSVGIDVYADTRIKLIHYGQFGYQLPMEYQDDSQNQEGYDIPLPEAGFDFDRFPLSEQSDINQG